MCVHRLHDVGPIVKPAPTYLSQTRLVPRKMLACPIRSFPSNIYCFLVIFTSSVSGTAANSICKIVIDPAGEPTTFHALIYHECESVRPIYRLSQRPRRYYEWRWLNISEAVRSVDNISTTCESLICTARYWTSHTYIYGRSKRFPSESD